MWVALETTSFAFDVLPSSCDWHEAKEINPSTLNHHPYVPGSAYFEYDIAFQSCHEKTNIFHMRKQRRRTASR